MQINPLSETKESQRIVLSEWFKGEEVFMFFWDTEASFLLFFFSKLIFLNISFLH